MVRPAPETGILASAAGGAAPSEAARAEAARWASIAVEWTAVRHADSWAMRPPTEADVVRFFDPHPDLGRRAATWSYPVGDGDLADLALFAAALAAAEADAWDADEPHVATRAFEDRRFLAGDRIIPWAVPWLYCLAGPADAVPLLALGDVLRPAPGEGTKEGLAPPGEDAFGPLDPCGDTAEFLLSSWSGLVLTPAEASLPPQRLAARYAAAAPEWLTLAQEHPGTSRLWRDLAERAAATARRLGGGD